MPQLDPSGYAPQLIWLAITFLALFVIMARAALPKISRVLEEREERIADDLDEAERLQKEAEAVEQKIEAILARARGEAQAIATETKGEIEARTAKVSQELDEKLTARLNEAERRVARAKTEALAGIDQTVVDAAADIVAKLTGAKPDKGALENAADSGIEKVKEERGRQ